MFVSFMLSTIFLQIDICEGEGVKNYQLCDWEKLFLRLIFLFYLELHSYVLSAAREKVEFWAK